MLAADGVSMHSISCPPARMRMLMVSLFRIRVSASWVPPAGTGFDSAVLCPSARVVFSTLPLSFVSKNNVTRSELSGSHRGIGGRNQPRLIDCR